MINRQIKEKKYEAFQAEILQNARTKPYCPIHEIGIVFNEENYSLFIQPNGHNKVCALYALHFIRERGNRAAEPELITDNKVLSALMEMIIYQGIKKRFN